MGCRWIGRVRSVFVTKPDASLAVLSNNSNPTGNHHKKYTVIGIFRSHSSAYSVVHEIYSSSVPSYRAGADLRPDGSCSSPSCCNRGEGNSSHYEEQSFPVLA